MTPAKSVFGPVFALALALNISVASAPIAAAAAAAESQGADAGGFVQDLGNRAIAQLAGQQIPEQEERARFRRLLNEAFDLNAIGKFTVGRAYWSTATPQQQQQFLSLYETQVTNAYAKRFQDYSGEQFRVNGQNKEDGGDTVVNSEITRPSGGQPVQVQWRVRPEGGSLKIVDVVIEGISMAVTDRQQFSAVIQRGGGTIDSLIDALKNQNMAVAQPPARARE
jgi:phospholipid transport system substrate-binding protein